MWVLGPRRVWKWSGGGFRFIWTKFQPKWTILGPFGSIFGTIYFSKSCWPRNLLPGDVVEIFISLIYEKLAFLGPTGPDGDPWRPKADFLEAEGRRRGVWGRSPQQNGALWGPTGDPCMENIVQACSLALCVSHRRQNGISEVLSPEVSEFDAMPPEQLAGQAGGPDSQLDWVSQLA